MGRKGSFQIDECLTTKTRITPHQLSQKSVFTKHGGRKWQCWSWIHCRVNGGICEPWGPQPTLLDFFWPKVNGQPPPHRNGSTKQDVQTSLRFKVDEPSQGRFLLLLFQTLCERHWVSSRGLTPKPHGSLAFTLLLCLHSFLCCGWVCLANSQSVLCWNKGWGPLTHDRG